MSALGKRVLLTGANGFTGRYMQAELQAHGYEVIGLGRPTSGNPMQDGSSLLAVDLRDQDALARLMAEVRPELVIHLAAMAFVGHGGASDFYNVNLIGTRNLLEALASSAVMPERVLLASSANVYGNASAGVLNEATPAAPANDYAVSKLAMEYVAKLWMGRLPIVLTRPFNYTGIGQAENFLIPKIVAHFRRRESSIELGNTAVWRDFSDVRAVVQAYRRLLSAEGAVGETVNVCSGEAHSLGEVISMCENITGHSLTVKVNPAFVRQNEVKVLRGDNSLLQQLIGPWSSPALEQTLGWMLGGD